MNNSNNNQLNKKEEAKNIHGFSDNKIINQSKENRLDIMRLQGEMEKMPSTLDQFPVDHHFAPGAYARSMILPAGHVIIGKIHKHAHLNIISYGHVAVTTESGTEEIFGPKIFTSFAGTKRAVAAIEDTMWTTIHITEETDLKKIEAEIIAPSFEEFEKLELRGEK